MAGLIAIIAVMGFGFIACDDGGGGGGGETGHTHDWGEWTQTTAPTGCTTEGEETRVCKLDATHTETRPIPALGHDYEWVGTTAPSLITEGEETGTCKHDSSHTETRATPSTPITTTEEWNTALSQISEKTGGEYTLNISGDIGVAGITTFPFGTTTSGFSLSVTLKGSGKLYLTSQGSLIRISARQTLIIDSENLTLQGLGDNNNSVIYVAYGTLELRNGTISGNTTTSGGGVYVNTEGTFTMSGGEISGNTASDSGGGVYVRETFTMSGGKISGNTGPGGGVYVYDSATFTMSGGKISGNTGSGGGVQVRGSFTMSSGEISGNTAPFDGGGVYVYNSATFTMSGGEISGNTATTDGGGVYVSNATFTMRGGEIFGNTASRDGGGVCVANAGTFRIVTGTIYGSNTDESLKNIAAESGAALYKPASCSAQRGIFTGGVWTKAEDGDLVTTNNTIDVKDGDNV
jgi:predicted outer membrane repeat protein